MAKLTKEELMNRINELELSDDVKISLMEDISDSLEENTDVISKEEFDDITNKYEELLSKYKERFLNSKEEIKEEKEDKEYEEKEVIDVKEI